MSLKPKKDKIYKVRDPVHGFVKLDAQEMDIVNSPVYQRLRRIRQLSLTEMLYPGANHTRFEHSLGVLQLASEMFDHITADEGNLDRLGIKRKDLERPRKMIRLAALLHDIGHAPFSHAGEGVMPLLPENHLRYKEGKQERYEHEDYSIAAIKWIFRDYIDKNPTCDTLGIKAEDVAAL
ncbi:MAG: HD domain-containing protein, partial [Oscillospiraceae bacterium]|nr:HD domain-containing protein [Oscillospiraceae bacterium]